MIMMRIQKSRYGIFSVLITLILNRCTGCDVNQFSLDSVGGQNRCCDKCLPGYGVVYNCTKENNTVCDTCTDGTFSSHINHYTTCKGCAACKNAYIMHPCNATHDAVCKCHVGFYLASYDNTCNLCDLCPAGWGASRSCNYRENTVCTQCSNGTFSNKLSAFARCIPCSKCSENQVLLQRCTTSQDTVCLDIPKETQPPSVEQPVIQEDDDDDADIIPLYCAILGAVVVGLLGYVVFKNYRRMKAKARHNGHDPHDDVEYSKASGGDSGVFVDADAPVKINYSPATKIKDLPPGRRKELEKVLSLAGSDIWKSLAHELGYYRSRAQFGGFRQLPDNTAAQKQMFNDWSMNDSATVSVLVVALMKLGRHDVIRFFYTDPPPDQRLAGFVPIPVPVSNSNTIHSQQSVHCGLLGSVKLQQQQQQQQQAQQQQQSVPFPMHTGHHHLNPASVGLQGRDEIVL